MSKRFYKFIFILNIQLASATACGAAYMAFEYLSGRTGFHPFIMGMYFLFALIMPHLLDLPENCEVCDVVDNLLAEDA